MDEVGLALSGLARTHDGELVLILGVRSDLLKTVAKWHRRVSLESPPGLKVGEERISGIVIFAEESIEKIEAMVMRYDRTVKKPEPEDIPDVFPPEEPTP